MVNSLLLATVIRTALVVISYGCKVPAGIFVPSMAVGATFGRMVGILVKALYRYADRSRRFRMDANFSWIPAAPIRRGAFLLLVIPTGPVSLPELMPSWERLPASRAARSGIDR